MAVTHERPSPKGKTASLFVTCMVDALAPQTGLAVVRVLESLGLAVDFPMAQTCCGQPGFNAGYRQEARAVARQFLRAFQQAEVIVTPSGSCAAMVRHEYPALFAGDPELQRQAAQLAAITWEFSEFIVEGLRSTQIVPDLESWMAAQRADGFAAMRGASNIVVVSGPSRTADIAMELVMGMHGPRELHIVLLP